MLNQAACKQHSSFILLKPATFSFDLRVKHQFLFLITNVNSKALVGRLSCDFQATLHTQPLVRDLWIFQIRSHCALAT